MWFTDQSGLIGRIAGDGEVRDLALPTAGSHPDGIAVAPDRTLWVADPGTNCVLHLTIAGRRSASGASP